MKRLIALILLALPLCAADMYIRQRGPYLTVARGVTWAGSGAGAFNNTYLFTPLSPDQGVCVFVRNNNNTNAHTFTLNVYQTGDPSIMSHAINTGRFIADTVQGTVSPVAALATTSAYIHANAAARVALVFAGGGALAGTPDTADIFVVQTDHTSCGPVAGETSEIPVRHTGNTTTWAALNSVSSTPSYDNILLYPAQHTIQYAVTGPPTTCTCALQGSQDGTAWFDISGDEDCVTVNMFHVVYRAVRYVRMNISVFTGAGTVTFQYTGAR